MSNIPQNIEAEKSLLGSIMLRPTALVEIIDEFSTDIFYDSRHRYISEAMLEMFESGQNIDIVTISNYFTEKGNRQAVGGISYINELANSVPSSTNIEYYLKIVRDKFLRRNLIQKSEQIIQGATDESNDIISLTSEFISDISNQGSVESGGKSIAQALDEFDNNVQEFIDSGRDFIGQPTGFRKLDGLLNGIQRGHLGVLSAYTSSGKGQPLDEPVLTSNGFVPMGSISVGDYVIGSNGNETMVTGVYPQGKKDTYKITFTDGSSTRCDYSHLWSVQNKFMKKSNSVSRKQDDRWMTLDTLELIEYMKKNKVTLKIPIVKPVNFKKKKELLIEPYTLGALIGDGSFRKGSIRITNTEDDILNKISYSVSEEKDPITYGVIGAIHDIRKLGLDGCRSWEKFIPEEYLYASIQERKSLLAGLIDTDGSVCLSGDSGIGGAYEYSTTSKRLAEQIGFLVNSLGGTFTIKSRIGIYKKNGKKKETRINYRIRIVPPESDSFHSSEKHSSRFKQRRCSARRTIKSIEFVGKTETQCIKVEAPDSLYVTKNFIVTHNTAFGLNIFWEFIKSGKSVHMFSLEMSPAQLVGRLLSVATGIQTKKIATGNLTESERESLNDARILLRKSESMIYSNNNWTYIKMTLFKLSMRKKTDLIILDYLQLIKMGKSLFETMMIVSQELQYLLQKFEIPMIALSQISNESNKATNDDHKTPKGAGDISASADWVALMKTNEKNNDIRDMKKEEGMPINVKFIINKNRHGGTGFVDFYFLTHTGKFHEQQGFDLSPYSKRIMEIEAMDGDSELDRAFSFDNK